MEEMSLLKTKKMVVHLWKSVHFWRNGREFSVFVTPRYQYNGKFCDPRGYLYVICVTCIPVGILTKFGVWMCPILPYMPMHPNTLKDVLPSDMTPRLMSGSKKTPGPKTWLVFWPVIKVKAVILGGWYLGRLTTEQWFHIDVRKAFDSVHREKEVSDMLVPDFLYNF